MMADGSAHDRASRIELATTSDFILGGLLVRPSRRQVCRGDHCRELEPRVMQVLVALASVRPEVVSRNRLIDSCWNGRIVGDDAINRCIVALRQVAREIAPEAFAIETVSRVGYYLVENEQASTSLPSLPDSLAASAPVRPKVGLALALTLLLLATVALGIYLSMQAAGPAGSPAEPVTIAVLPFDNLSRDAPHFAEGLSEEIRDRLSRDPQFRVAGRTSSSIAAGSTDAREVGRRLGVAFVLEGSVRVSGDRVRVTAALVQARDGMRLWANNFEGRLNDVFAIEQQVGMSTAGALRVKLARGVPRSGLLPSRGDVYSLYLTARGLIRQRDPKSFASAEEKLRRAVALDPNFAPAWSSLAQVEQAEGQGDDPQARATYRQAVAHATRALALAPDFAEAHAVLGLIIYPTDPAGAAHIKRAAALDPNNAEYQYWLGHVLGNESDFEAMLDANRRAFAIDPLWELAQEAVLIAAWQMGHREEALTYVRRIENEGSRQQAHLARASLARARGDFSSEAAELARARAATNDAGKRMMVDWRRGLILLRLGINEEARRLLSGTGRVERSLGAEPYLQLRAGRLPSIEELKARNRNIPYFFEDRAYAAIAVKLLLNAGRARDVAALYDSEEGILGISRRSLPAQPAHSFEDAPLIAIALQSAGRGAEAERILDHLDRSIDLAWKRSGGRAPPWFIAAAAQTWALRRQPDRALSGLERAIENGWVYVGGLDDASLRDLDEEPAFRSLRGHPRFERIRSRIRAHILKERRELLALQR